MYQIFVYSDRFLHRGEPLQTFTLLTETDLVKLVRRNLGRGPFKHQCRHIFRGDYENVRKFGDVLIVQPVSNQKHLLTALIIQHVWNQKH